jgi:hypothetical protein
MKTYIKIIAAMLTLIIALTLLGGCGKEQNTTSDDQAIQYRQTDESGTNSAFQQQEEDVEKGDDEQSTQQENDIQQSEEGTEPENEDAAVDNPDKQTENDTAQTPQDTQTSSNGSQLRQEDNNQASTEPDVTKTETETEPEPTPEPEPEPYSEKTADTVLTITGAGVDRDYYFTLSQLQSLGGVFEDDYFSRGKDPKTATTHYKGISVSYLLDVVGASGKKATFTASDGYAVSYSMSAISASYIDETVPGKSLKMILAWQEDYASCALRLVMGQNIEGEYNRTNWVREVIEIEVKA